MTYSAEEVRDASIVIPWAMVVSYFLNAGTFRPFLNSPYYFAEKEQLSGSQ